MITMVERGRVNIIFWMWWALSPPDSISERQEVKNIPYLSELCMLFHLHTWNQQGGMAHSFILYDWHVSPRMPVIHRLYSCYLIPAIQNQSSKCQNKLITVPNTYMFITLVYYTYFPKYIKCYLLGQDNANSYSLLPSGLGSILLETTHAPGLGNRVSKPQPQSWCHGHFGHLPVGLHL